MCFVCVHVCVCVCVHVCVHVCVRVCVCAWFNVLVNASEISLSQIFSFTSNSMHMFPTIYISLVQIHPHMDMMEGFMVQYSRQ